MNSFHSSGHLYNPRGGCFWNTDTSLICGPPLGVGGRARWGGVLSPDSTQIMLPATELLGQGAVVLGAEVTRGSWNPEFLAWGGMQKAQEGAASGASPCLSHVLRFCQSVLPSPLLPVSFVCSSSSAHFLSSFLFVTLCDSGSPVHFWVLLFLCPLANPKFTVLLSSFAQSCPHACFRHFPTSPIPLICLTLLPINVSMAYVISTISSTIAFL